MSQLPFLVVYGELVWKTALLVLVVGLPLAHVLRLSLGGRARARGKGTALAAAPTPPSSFANDAEVVLEGDLVAEGAPYEQAPEGCAAATVGRRRLGPGSRAGCRAPKLGIRVGDVDVALVGEVEVVAGSSEAHHLGSRRDVPRGLVEVADEAIPLHALHAHPVVFSVRSGDRVRVAGVLNPVAAGAEAEYRESASAWELHPTGEAILVAARRGPLLVRPRTWALVVRAALGALVFLFTFWLGGSVSLDRAKDADHVLGSRTPDPDVEVITSLQIAAATPFHRDDALSLLSSDLEYEARPSAATLEARLAVLELTGECERAVEYLDERQRFDRALALAQTCPESPDWPFVKGRIAARAGHVEKSAVYFASVPPDELYPHEDLALEALILARRWGDAREVAEARLSYLKRMASTEPELRTHYESSAEGVACLSLALGARAGDATAREALLAAEPGRGEGACRILAADLADADARGDLLLVDEHIDFELEWVAELLLAEVGASPRSAGGVPTLQRRTIEAALVVAPGRTGLVRAAGLGLLVAASESDAVRGTLLDVELSLELVLWNQLIDRGDEADAHLDHASKVMSSLRAKRAALDEAGEVELPARGGAVYDWQWNDYEARLAEVAAALALRRGEMDDYRSHLEALSEDAWLRKKIESLGRLLAGEVDEVSAGLDSYYGDRLRQPLTEALHGEGEALIELVEDSTWLGLSGWLSALAPRLRHLREPLERVVRHRRSYAYGDMGGQLVVHAGRGRFAEGIGSDAWAKDEYARAQALFDLFADRATAVLLLVADRL